MIILCDKTIEEYLKKEKDYNDESSYNSNTHVNSCFEINIATMERTNQYKRKDMFYDTKRNELVWADEGYSHDGFIEYCTFDYYEFVVDFINRHKLPKADKFFEKLEDWFPEKCIHAGQAGIFLDDVADETPIETQKITRKIGAFSAEEKATPIITKARLDLAELFQRELYHKATLLISAWCANNSVPFIVKNNYLGFDNNLFNGDLTRYFNCHLSKSDKGGIEAILEYKSKVSLDSMTFESLELQKKNSSEWEKYVECDVNFVDEFSSASIGIYYFRDLPSGVYRFKSHFKATAQNSDMKIYEQEGLFYSKEMEI